MSAACPFCGDERKPYLHGERPNDGEKPREIYTACCQCCGAQGPLSTSKEGAWDLWDNREAPGSSAVWREQFKDLT